MARKNTESPDEDEDGFEEDSGEQASPLTEDEKQEEDVLDNLHAASMQESFDADFEPESPVAHGTKPGNADEVAATATTEAADEMVEKQEPAVSADVQEGVGEQPVSNESSDNLLEEAELLLKDSPQCVDPKEPTLMASRKELPALDADADRRPRERMASSASTPALATMASTDIKDLRKKTEFANISTNGINQKKPKMGSVSAYKTAPCFSFGSRNGTGFIRSVSTPAPGVYDVPDNDKDKFKASEKFSFGGQSRFGLAQNPAKRMPPGPGSYNPRDPVSEMTPKVGFGSSMRLRGAILAQTNPGPGAYENRSTMGQGLTFTARGRHPAAFVASKSSPGPGAYNPVCTSVHQGPPKCGFGTSRRDNIMKNSRFAPGPGTYELQNFRSTGSDAPKYSATSRRRVHDLESYMTPGPGSYNAHLTSFAPECSP